jgi:hypothetical protein
MILFILVDNDFYVATDWRINHGADQPTYRRLNVRMRTPPHLETIRFQAVRCDFSRISGLVLLHLLQALDPDPLFAS